MVSFKTPELTPTALAAGQVGSGRSDALFNAADAAQGAANTFSEFFENEARIERERLLARAQADWSRTFNERAADAGPGFAAQMTKDYQSYVSEALKNAPKRGRDNLELAFEKYGLDIETRAMQAEAAARARAKAAAVAEAKKARADALRMQGNRLISDTSLLDEYMQADPENADYYVKIANDARMQSDPLTVRDEMIAGKWDAYLSPSEKLAFIKGGNAAVERANRDDEIARNVERKAYESALEEDIAYANVNGSPPVDAAWDADTVGLLYEGEDRAALQQSYERAIADAEMLHSVSMATPEALQSQIDELVTAVSEPLNTPEDVALLKSFTDAVRARDTEIATDAAGYVLRNSDEAAASYTAYSDAEPEDRATAAQRYAAAVDANYDVLGVQDDFRNLLPKSAVAATVKQFNEMPVDVAAETLRQYRSEWGNYGGSITAELTKAGLAPEYAVAMRFPENPGLQAAIASLRGQSLADLSAGIEATKMSDAKKELGAGIEDYLIAFESGDATGEATKTFGLHYGVAEKLMSRYLRDGMDSSVAAERVIGQMFPETPINSSVARVLVPSGIDPAGVEDALDAAMDDAALRRFDPAPLDDPRIPEFADQERLIAAARQGVWLNNSTGSGAVLHLDIGGYLLPVIGKTGRPYQVIFGQEVADERPAPVTKIRNVGRNND